MLDRLGIMLGIMSYLIKTEKKVERKIMWILIQTYHTIVVAVVVVVSERDKTLGSFPLKANCKMSQMVGCFCLKLIFILMEWYKTDTD